MNLDWRIKWDYRFMEMAKLVASWSKDPSTKVGAVIVDRDNIVQGMGYNGFPRGVDDSDERYQDREWKYPLVVHAEANAILNAGKRAKGARIYVWPTLMMPAACPECAKLIVQSGVKQIIYFHKDNVEARWEKNAKFTSVLFTEGGVQTRAIKDYSDGGPVL
jgi:dCMP deaminase